MDYENEFNYNELIFLKFFFEQAEISIERRAFIEESFEMIFNKKVPSNYKLNMDTYNKGLKNLKIPGAPKIPAELIKSIEEEYEVKNKADNTPVSLSDIITKLNFLSEK